MVFSGFSLILDQSSGKLKIRSKFYHQDFPIKKVNPHLKSKIQALNLEILFTKLLPTFYLLSSLFSFFLSWLKRKKTSSKSHWQFFSPKIFDAAYYFSFKTFFGSNKKKWRRFISEPSEKFWMWDVFLFWFVAISLAFSFHIDFIFSICRAHLHFRPNLTYFIKPFSVIFSTPYACSRLSRPQQK